MTRTAETARGLAFYALFYGGMALGGLAFGVPALLGEGAARAVAKLWFRAMFAVLRVVGGVRVAIRGPAPTGRVIVAAKHQSMLDVFALFAALPEARFAMKRELTRAPVFGFFALRVGAVPVDRGGGSAALRAMVEALADKPGQLVIYPQGTRVAPGARAPYKIGVHALYEATGLPVVPAATNSGLFWPRGVAIRPGLAVVEFLDPIPPGLDRDTFMARLEDVIEAGSARLAS
jgi:1-acyl-sn-glycerol-3-phosphate acyltransferase